MGEPCFRATATGTYVECPMKWWLSRRQGWELSIIGAKEVAACLGTGFHAGAEHLLMHPDEVEQAQELARQSAVKTTGEIYSSGRVIKPAVKAELDALGVRLTNAIKALAAGLPMIFDEYDTVATELTLPEAGGTTLDLLLRHKAEGHLTVLDWKAKTFSKPWYKTDYLEDFGHSWQLFQYAWGASQRFGEPVEHFLLGLMDVTGKAKLELYPYRIYPHEQQLWEVSAKQVWRDMQDVLDGKRPVQIATEHRSKFGRCDYYNACLMYDLDEDRMQGEYIQIREN